MSKGSTGQQGPSTNPTAMAQMPYLQDYWAGLKTAYENNPQSYYPGQTLADYRAADPTLTQGYANLANAGQSLDQSLRPTANAAWNTLASGGAGYQNSPAYGGLNAFATGQTGPQQQYDAIGNAALNSPYPGQIAQYAPQVAGYGAQAAGPNIGTRALGQAAQGQGMGLNALANTASGAYLNSNPYLDAMYRSAADPVSRTYQTATAPTTDAAFSGGGRYGSGAAAGARDTNELNLGKALGDLSSNIYGQNYARERQAQDAAAQNYTSLTNQAANAYGTLRNQGLDTAIRGGTAAGGLEQAAGSQALAGQTLGLSAAQQQALAQQYGLSGLGSAFNAGNTALQNAAQMYPQLAQAQLTGANAEIAAGKGLTEVDQTYRTYQQQTIDDAMKRYNADQAQPWTNLNMYGAGLGAVPAGTNATQPYFQNPLASTLGGISGGLGIANQLSGAGGLSGLLGGLGGAGSTASVLSGIGSGALPAVIAPEIGAAGLSALGAMNTGIPAIAAAAAPAAWIVCTELTRQGRMPKRHYLAGISLFAAYPERTKQGYYFWSIPAVRHLRRYPDSRWSRVLAAIACWRSENIAAKRGVRGARRLVRGMLVSAIGYPLCAMLGCFVAPQDWRSVYREEKA